MLKCFHHFLPPPLSHHHSSPPSHPLAGGLGGSIPTMGDLHDVVSVQNDVHATLYFPPRAQCNFVIHYEQMSFHVHDFVLAHHSVWFREYLALRQTDTKAESDDICKHGCDRCVHLPLIPRTESKDMTPCTGFQIRAVLSYMYFRRSWFAPPLCPINNKHPEVEDWDDSPFSPYAAVNNHTLEKYCEGGTDPPTLVGVMSAVKYLDCTILHLRIDHVLSNYCVMNIDNWKMALQMLVDVEQFDLKQTNISVFSILDRNTFIFKTKEWEVTHPMLSRAMLLQLLSRFVT